MTTSEAGAAVAEDAVTRRQVIAAAAASVLGWSLDLFDLFIILYVAPVIAPLFFPSHILTLSLAAVYASFAVTVLMRPVGSAIFGRYADKQGRKRAMMIAIIGVGLATALLGTLPTFTQVGVLGSILFLVLRLLQGIFVGGVVASTHTIGTETVSPRWRGLMSGLIGGAGAGVGALLGSITFSLWSSVFPGSSFSIWGWRAMFFSGLLTTIIGLFIFRSLEESPLWLRQQKKQEQAEKAPLKTLFAGHYLPVVLLNLVIVIGTGTLYYLTAGYLPTFLSQISHVPRTASGLMMIGGSLIMIVSALLVGHLSERTGRKAMFLIVGVVCLILVPTAYLFLSSTSAANLGLITFYVLLLSFLGNATCGLVPVFLNERFPTAIRASGTSISWNIGFAVGGLTPTFVTLVSPSVKNIPLNLAIFLAVAAIILLIGGLIAPETKGIFE